MTGIEVILELRRSGVKPSAVMVDLVPRNAVRDAHAMSSSGIVTVDIGTTDSLSDIDFRPLVGLRVFVADFASDPARHSRVCRLIAKVKAAHMVMPVWKGESLTVHQRWAGDPIRSESFAA